MNEKTYTLSNRLISLMPMAAGPLTTLFMLLGVDRPAGFSAEAWLVASCMAWMAIWWIFEAVPVAATALLALILFPLMGLGTFKEVAQSYAHPIIYLFLGGFMIALGIQRWNLHKRIALLILLAIGDHARHLLGGFMLAATLLSMWISNTATTIILLPMVLAVITVVADTMDTIDVHQRENFEKALLLGIAYAATIGGVSTLIGTPPNAFMAAFLEETYGISIGFTQWMAVGMPLSLLMLPLTWFLLCGIVYPFNFHLSSQTLDTLKRSKSELGPVSREEYLVIAVFVCTAMGWMCRPILNKMDAFTNLTDSTIAVIAGVTMFLLPSNRTESGRLLDWSDTRKLPWGILILFGGGLALAKGVTDSGLAQVLANMLTSLDALNMFFLMALFVAVVVFFTELSGNLATTAAFLPVVGVLAVNLGIDPIMLIAPVALAASCAFMMPVGTPPNAIVYSSEKVTIMQMAKAGFVLNIIAIVAVSALSALLVPKVLGS